MASFLSASLSHNIYTWLKKKKIYKGLTSDLQMKKIMLRKSKGNLLESIRVRDPQSPVHESAAVPQETCCGYIP